MKKWFTNRSVRAIDDQINKVLDEMAKTDIQSDKYQKLMRMLYRLTTIKAQSSPDKVSKDMLISVGGHLMSIGVLLAFEYRHVITSQKAFTQIGRAIRPS